MEKNEKSDASCKIYAKATLTKQEENVIVH
jgi:hypothetical protein